LRKAMVGRSPAGAWMLLSVMAGWFDVIATLYF
jgi:hypothetical protein